MSSTTIKVTPTSRGNFSKLRKYQTGGGILKYASPTSGIHKGVIYNPGSTWQGDIFSKFQLDILNELALAKTPEEKAAVIKKYNDALTTYAQLRSGVTDLGLVSYNLGVSDYLNLINNSFGFVNRNGVKNGTNINRYNYLAGDKRYTTGDRADSWNSDGWWGGLTLDRTILGYKGDWDENSDVYKAWQDLLNQYGMETFMDTDNAYKLRLKQNPETPPQTPPLTPPETPPQTPPNTPPIEYPHRDPLEFEKKSLYKGSPWTDWIPLSANLANDLITNRRNYEAELKKKFPLLEAPYQLATVTDNYAARLIRLNLAADIRARSKLNLSSNEDYNMAVLNNAESLANQLEELNAVDQTLRYNETTKIVNNVANLNNKSAVATANINTSQNAAAFNNALVAKQKLLASDAAKKNSYMTNMYTSHGQWLQNERLEEARFNREMNEYDYLKKALKLYTDSGLEELDGPDGLYKSRAFSQLVLELIADTENGPDDILDDNGNISIEKIQDWVAANPEDERVKKLEKLYKKEYDSANRAYELQLQKYLTEKLFKNINIRSTETNQGSRFGDYLRRGPQISPLYQKSGGKATRFVEYMEHYRKAQSDVNKVNLETQKLLLKLLDRDLGILDKETLLLLKAAFK